MRIYVQTALTRWEKIEGAAEDDRECEDEPEQFRFQDGSALLPDTTHADDDAGDEGQGSGNHLPGNRMGKAAPNASHEHDYGVKFHHAFGSVGYKFYHRGMPLSKCAGGASLIGSRFQNRFSGRTPRRER